MLSSVWFLFLFFQGGKSLEEQKKQFDELGALPLSTNPFFVKNIANSDEVNFEGMLYDIFFIKHFTWKRGDYLSSLDRIVVEM